MKFCLLKILLISFVVLLFPAFGLAQRTPIHPVTLEVHGQVRYAETKTPAAHILVRLDTFGGGMVAQILTDREGKFLFSGLASTQYTVTIHAPGYKDVQQMIDLLTATSDFVYVYLARELPRISSIKIGYIDANVPEEARKEFEKGHVALAEQKKPALALQHFEKAVSLYSKFFEAELSLGTLYMDLGQWENAEQALRRAVEINPKVPNALFALGELSFQQRRYPEAEKLFVDGLKIDNRSWQAHFTLGRLYWNTGALIKAGRHVALTIQLNPNLAEAHLLGANILLRAGKRDDALSEFEEYLRLEPKGVYANQVRAAISNVKSKEKK
jgi:tetratricopeptide (TPR) repeat protein